MSRFFVYKYLYHYTQSKIYFTKRSEWGVNEKHKNNSFLDLSLPLKAQRLITSLWINYFTGFARHASKLRVYETTINYNVELAHVKSTAFNYLNKTLFTKRSEWGVNEKHKNNNFLDLLLPLKAQRLITSLWINHFTGFAHHASKLRVYKVKLISILWR